MAELTIGARIRDLRRPTYTQHDLAAAADVHMSVSSSSRGARVARVARRHWAPVRVCSR